MVSLKFIRSLQKGPWGDCLYFLLVSGGHDTEKIEKRWPNVARNARTNGDGRTECKRRYTLL